jgi:hypothetical protein
MRACGLVLGLAGLVAMTTGAQAGTPDVCAKPSEMTLSGTLRGMQSLREEPQAEVETYFDIELASPICGKATVKASVIGFIPCANGDAVTMTGEFSPPSKLTGMARMKGDVSGLRCEEKR